MKEQHAGFRDPTVLTRWTRRFLYAYIAVELVEWIWGPSDAVMAGTVWSAVYMIVVVTTGILVLVWIHRANYNARQLGAADMRFTPGWSVAWYFIPVAWFWKPYQVMREIWQASVSPADWKQQASSPLLPWWWGLWILYVIGGSIAGYIAGFTGAETVESAIDISVAIVLIVSPVLVLLAIIRRVHQMQMGHYRSPEGSQ